MPKGLKRVIIGIILVSIGIFGWYQIMMESIPPPNSPPPWYGVNMFSSFPVMIVHSVIAGIGAVVLVSGVRAYRAS